MKKKDLLYFDPVSRRMFIKAIGGGLVTFPLLESFLGEKAFAAASDKKFFIGISTPNQCEYSLTSPSALHRNAIPANYASVVDQLTDEDGWNYRKILLQDVISRQGHISDLLDSKFNSIANYITTIRGYDFAGRIDHGRGTTLGNMAACHLGASTNASANLTIDEFMANSTNFYESGRNTVARDILRLGETSISTSRLDGSNGGQQGIGIGGNNGGLSYNGNLSLAFNDLFGGGVPTTPTLPNPSNYKRNVVDRILASVNTLKNRSGMGATDRLRIEEYQDNLSELSNRIGSVTPNPTPTPTCSTTGVSMPNIAPNGLGNASNGAQLVTDYYTNAASLIALSIKCGLTRISTLGISSSITSNGQAAAHNGAPRTWHLNYAHGNNTTELRALNKWTVDNVLHKLTTELNTDNGVGSNYLDYGLIYFASECSYGHSGEASSSILIGNTDSINAGQAFDYGNYALQTYSTSSREYGIGMPVGRFFVSLLRSMGLTSADYINRYGNTTNGFGHWPSSGTYPRQWEQYVGSTNPRTKVDKSLPGLLKA